MYVTACILLRVDDYVLETVCFLLRVGDVCKDTIPGKVIFPLRHNKAQ